MISPQQLQTLIYLWTRDAQMVVDEETAAYVTREIGIILDGRTPVFSDRDREAMAARCVRFLSAMYEDMLRVNELSERGVSYPNSIENAVQCQGCRAWVIDLRDHEEFCNPNPLYRAVNWVTCKKCGTEMDKVYINAHHRDSCPAG